MKNSTTKPPAGATYQAMIEVGRAQRTVFVARYLRHRDLQRESGDIATDRRDEQELSGVLCLRLC